MTDRNETEVEIPYVGGPLDGEIELYDLEFDPIDEWLVKGFFQQYEEHYDPQRPGTNPVHRYDLTRGDDGQLSLVYAGVMSEGTFEPGRVDGFARPDADVDTTERE